MGSRERRAVPANWKHPEHEDGSYKSLFYRYDLEKKRYDEGVEAIKKGLVATGVFAPKDTPEWVEPHHHEAAGYSLTLEEWEEEKIAPECYMLQFPNEKELTHVQLYDTGCEGKPISPVFASDAELTGWLLEQEGSVEGRWSDVPDQWSLSYELFLPDNTATSLFEKLIAETPWSQHTFNFSGKEVNMPRLTAWYSVDGFSYGYSGLKEKPLPFTHALEHLRKRLEVELDIPFNSVLLNYYRDGNDSVSWHSDNEPELTPCMGIASLSLGATRLFQLQKIEDIDGQSPPTGKIDIELKHGSLLVMRGLDFQKLWKHRIPKQKGNIDPRINLTFRYIHKG